MEKQKSGTDRLPRLLCVLLLFLGACVVGQGLIDAVVGVIALLLDGFDQAKKVLELNGNSSGLQGTPLLGRNRVARERESAQDGLQ